MASENARSRCRCIGAPDVRRRRFGLTPVIRPRIQADVDRPAEHGLQEIRRGPLVLFGGARVLLDDGNDRGGGSQAPSQ